MSKYILPRGIVRACAGIVEGVAADPYTVYVADAAAVVGANYGSSEAAQVERARLVEAIKLNLVNRYENPYELLARRYGLPISLATFKREKEKYCFRLAQLCGFVET